MMALTFILIQGPLDNERVKSMPKFIEEDLRIGHAKELLGSSYKSHGLNKLENRQGLEAHIQTHLDKALPFQYKNWSFNITQMIIKESARHQLDPFLILAIIKRESRFNPEAIGGVGEIGLMQIRPETAAWITKKLKLRYSGKESLMHPMENIRIGVAYISWLRKKFNFQSQLYLSAYNMGQVSLKRALKNNIMPMEYSGHVMKNYLTFYRSI